MSVFIITLLLAFIAGSARIHPATQDIITIGDQVSLSFMAKSQIIQTVIAINIAPKKEIKIICLILSQFIFSSFNSCIILSEGDVNSTALCGLSLRLSSSIPTHSPDSDSAFGSFSDFIFCSSRLIWISLAIFSPPFSSSFAVTPNSSDKGIIRDISG